MTTFFPTLPASIRLPLLLVAAAAGVHAAEHPLATVTRRLPASTATTRVTAADGNVMILSAELRDVRAQ